MISKFRFYVCVLCMLLIETMLCSWSVHAATIVLVPIGILLVTYIPGSLCVDILFPGKSLKVYERVALSLALSAVIVLTIPFAVSLIGIPFFRLPVVLSTDAVVICLMVGSAWRTRLVIRIKDPVKVGKLSLVVALVCAGMFMTVFGIAEVNLTNRQPSFYLTDSTGKLTNYPFQIQKSVAFSMELHIVNPTRSTLNGTVKATAIAGTTLWSTPVVVTGNHSWQKRFKLPTDGHIGDMTVKFLFTVPNSPDMTRTLWVRYSIVLPPP